MIITQIRNLSISVQQNKDNYYDNDYNDNQLPGCAMRLWAKPRWKTATTPPPFCPRSESKGLIIKIEVK